MKKIVRLILLILLAAALLSITVFAVQPRWINVTSIIPEIKADVYTCTIDGLPGTTKIECTMTLYEKDWLGNYTELTHTSGTYYGRYNVFTGYYGIQSGKTYKMDMYGTVIRNGVSEPISCTFEKRC